MTQEEFIDRLKVSHYAYEASVKHSEKFSKKFYKKYSFPVCECIPSYRMDLKVLSMNADNEYKSALYVIDVVEEYLKSIQYI
ncbi:hypothetical protein FACS189463_3840 [Bacteroidia bacterium]|nr:hypothetical protein FACS189463_3840 [Bacteroidia bacterium]